MIVADSQSIYWYLLAPERLTSLAVGALESAEGLSAYELVRTTLLDPDTSIHVEPFSQRMWSHFEVASSALRDPFDSAIVATARVLGVRWSALTEPLARLGSLKLSGEGMPAAPGH